MIIQTRYNYEKIWTITTEQDILKIIAQEVGDADPHGTLTYIKEAIKKGKSISVGTCKFKMGEENVSK
jgi:hypothetical protein